MKLTCKNVDKVFDDSLFKDGEDTSTAVMAEGVISKFGFHPERVASHKEEIASMLSELPDSFKKGGGGGMSFLNACMTKVGNQWGEHRNMEQLFALGVAVGLVSYPLPREIWKFLPGGMPYVTVNV